MVLFSFAVRYVMFLLTLMDRLCLVFHICFSVKASSHLMLLCKLFKLRRMLESKYMYCLILCVLVVLLCGLFIVLLFLPDVWLTVYSVPGEE